MSNKQRINYNIPVEMVAAIKQFADEDGQPVNFWLRKTLERAIEERFKKQYQQSA